jgi:hypothetical protein
MKKTVSSYASPGKTVRCLDWWLGSFERSIRGLYDHQDLLFNGSNIVSKLANLFTVFASLVWGVNQWHVPVVNSRCKLAKQSEDQLDLAVVRLEFSVQVKWFVLPIDFCSSTLFPLLFLPYWELQDRVSTLEFIRRLQSAASRCLVVMGWSAGRGRQGNLVHFPLQSLRKYTLEGSSGLSKD